MKAIVFSNDQASALAMQAKLSGADKTAVQSTTDLTADWFPAPTAQAAGP